MISGRFQTRWQQEDQFEFKVLSLTLLENVKNY